MVPPFAAADEQPHPPGPQAWWAERWTFDLWTAEGVAACTSLTLLPSQGLAWYWAALVRPGLPLLHLADLAVPGARLDLDVRTEGLWASHTCEAAFEQWTVTNEAYAAALDDPAEALGRGLGVVTPIAFDLEWYGDGLPVPVTGGYAQDGTVEGLVELPGGALELLGASSRREHTWGVREAAVAEPGQLERRPPGAWVPFAMPGPDGPEVLDRVTRVDGWWERRRPA